MIIKIIIEITAIFYLIKSGVYSLRLIKNDEYMQGISLFLLIITAYLLVKNRLF